MNTEISKPQKVLQVRNNIQLYLDEEEARQVEQVINATDAPRFLRVQGRYIALSEIVGLFDPSDLERQHRLRSGQWQDKEGNWHDKGERVCPNHLDVVLQGWKTCGYCNA